METLLFWTLPVLAVLTGLKGRFIVGWRLFLCSGTALYAGVWLAPEWWSLLDFLPPELDAYRNGFAVAAGCVAFFAVLYPTAKALSRCDDDAFVFPGFPARVLNALCRFGFGACVSTLLMLLCAATPLRMHTRNNGSGFEAKAEAALLRFTRVGDKLTRTVPAKPRVEALADFRYVPPPPPEPEKESRQKRGGGKTVLPPASGQPPAAK